MLHIKIAGEQIQEMASDEVLEHVSASAYKRIHKTDKEPTFRAYCVGHEGESTGKVVGIGNVIKKWVRSAITNLTEKLNIGTKVFHLHEMDNVNDGRKPIGEVVGKTLSDIEGRLSSIAIMYIYPEYRDIPLDVASIEATFRVPENINPHARSIDVDVEDITAIALGNGRINKPGFAGATLLASLQEFAESKDRDIRSKGGDKMTNDELKQAVKAARLRISDLFEGDEIFGDPLVQEIVRDGKKGEYEHRRRTDEKFTEERAAWEKREKEYQAKIETANRGMLKIKAADSLKPAIEKRKLDEKQAAFVLANQSKFDPKNEDSLAGDVDKFLDSQLDEFKRFSEIVGIKAGDTGKPGVGAGKAGDTSLDDLLTPDALKDEIKK
jgi:hypothetical protein